MLFNEGHLAFSLTISWHSPMSQTNPHDRNTQIQIQERLYFRSWGSGGGTSTALKLPMVNYENRHADEHGDEQTGHGHQHRPNDCRLCVVEAGHAFTPSTLDKKFSRNTGTGSYSSWSFWRTAKAISSVTGRDVPSSRFTLSIETMCSIWPDRMS